MIFKGKAGKIGARVASSRGAARASQKAGINAIELATQKAALKSGEMLSPYGIIPNSSPMRMSSTLPPAKTGKIQTRMPKNARLNAKYNRRPGTFLHGVNSPYGNAPTNMPKYKPGPGSGFPRPKSGIYAAAPPKSKSLFAQHGKKVAAAVAVGAIGYGAISGRSGRAVDKQTGVPRGMYNY